MKLCPYCKQEIKEYEYRCQCGVLIGALNQANLDKAIERHGKKCCMKLCPYCKQEIKEYEYRCQCGVLIGALNQANLDKAVERHNKKCKVKGIGKLN